MFKSSFVIKVWFIANVSSIWIVGWLQQINPYGVVVHVCCLLFSFLLLRIKCIRYVMAIWWMFFVIIFGQILGYV
jgi:hypothetical protein